MANSEWMMTVAAKAKQANLKLFLESRYQMLLRYVNHINHMAATEKNDGKKEMQARMP